AGAAGNTMVAARASAATPASRPARRLSAWAKAPVRRLNSSFIYVSLPLCADLVKPYVLESGGPSGQLAFRFTAAFAASDAQAALERLAGLNGVDHIIEVMQAGGAPRRALAAHFRNDFFFCSV